jgi:phosphate transport system substrate-binding protein
MCLMSELTLQLSGVFMHRRIVLSLLALSAMSFGISAAQAQQINGAGATFPYAVYTKWAADYKAATGKQVNYQGIGSSGGVKQINAKTVDFAGSDSAVKVAALQKHGQVQVPTVMGGATIVVNLPGVKSGDIRLDGETAASIFRGAITKWNDAAIAALNPGKELPGTAITVAHRSDGSGTTNLVSHYLAGQSAAFKRDVGEGNTVNWPANAVGGKGNPGVAANVQKIVGAIGYVDIADAMKNNMVFVALKNKDGNFVLPSQKTIAAAASGADFNVPGMSPDLTNQPGKDAWPVVTATYMIAYEKGADATKQKAVVDFYTWALNNGQKAAAELGFVPLPASVVKMVEKEMSRIK